MRVDKGPRAFRLSLRWRAQLRSTERVRRNRGMMKQLITGAMGDVGSRVVEHLLKRNIRPSILVRNQAKARSLFGDRVDIFVSDLAEPASMRDALKKASTIYLVNVGPEIPHRDEAAAVLAKEAGVKGLISFLRWTSSKALRLESGTRRARLRSGRLEFRSPLSDRPASCPICLHGPTPSRLKRSFDHLPRMDAARLSTPTISRRFRSRH
jgi:NAD(P)H-binding